MTIMFALCSPLTSQVKRLEDRILHGEGGEALVFSTVEDAQRYRESLLADLPGTALEVERCEVNEEPRQYRILLRRLSCVPESEVRETMWSILPNDWRTEAYGFRSTPTNLGAMVRSILWAEGIPYNSVSSSASINSDAVHTLVRVQRQALDTRNHIAKLLSTPLPTWEDVGEWDCGGLDYTIGR